MRSPHPSPSDPDPATAEAQAQLAARLAALPVTPPPRLHARVATLTNDAAGRHRRMTWRFGLAGAATALVVAAVLLIAVARPAPAPAVPALARLALSAVAGRPPSVDPADPAVLRARVGDVAFPRWGAATGFSPIGQRTGRVAGRQVVAVAYRSPSGALVGYSIAAAPALASGRGSSQVVAGTRVTVGHDGGVTTVTWERSGHTCVLAARSVGAGQLISLAVGGYVTRGA